MVRSCSIHLHLAHLCKVSSVQGQTDVALYVASLFQTRYVLRILWAVGSALGLQPALKWIGSYFVSCGLYNKAEAFRSALDQHLDLLVSSVMAYDLVSVIHAVKVMISGVISGGWMCYPTPVPAAYPAG